MKVFKRFLIFMGIDPAELTREQLQRELDWTWVWPLLIALMMFLPGLLRGVK